jgi:hypothetical protein
MAGIISQRRWMAEAVDASRPGHGLLTVPGARPQVSRVVAARFHFNVPGDERVENWTNSSMAPHGHVENVLPQNGRPAVII